MADLRAAIEQGEEAARSVGGNGRARAALDVLLAAAREAEAALAEDPARRFGLLCLAAWWDESASARRTLSR